MNTWIRGGLLHPLIKLHIWLMQSFYKSHSMHCFIALLLHSLGSATVDVNNIGVCMSALSRGRGGYPVGSLLTSAMQCLILHKYFRAISPIRKSWLAFLFLDILLSILSIHLLLFSR